MEKEISRHVFTVDPHVSGGQELMLTTKFFPTGDPGGVFCNQELTLNSYCNSTCLYLSGACFSPEVLRKLANEMESALLNAKAKISPVAK